MSGAPSGAEGLTACPEPPFDIFQRLKQGTCDIHRQIEERVPIFRRGFNLGDYIQLIEYFYGFWAPIEIKLLRLKALEHPELDLEGRLKSSLLKKDLRLLGREAANLPRCYNLPAVDTFLQGLGCLYVLEGSTLGACLISKHIEHELQLTAGSGAAFFNAYGELTGKRWNAFRSFVAANVTSEGSEEIITAARQTFESFFEWLRAS